MTFSKPAPPLVAIGCAALLLIAAAFVFQAIAVSFQAYSPLPFLDEWDNLDLYKSLINDGNFIGKMLSQHNEHRIFFPRIILFSDYHFFNGTGRFDFCIIFLTQILQAGLFVYLIRACHFEMKAASTLAAIAVIVLFSMRQAENFNWGFQVQFVGVFASASLSATLLAHAVLPEWRGRRAVILALCAFALATISAFSMANGVLCGLVLLILAVLARVAAGLIGVIIALNAALFGIFLYGFRAEESHGLLSNLILHPARTPLFLFVYLGNIIDNDITSAGFLGAAGCIALAALLCRFFLCGDRSPTHLSLLGIALFAAGSAALTALGRSVDGLGGAFASRYVTGTASFWSAILILGWSAVGRSRFRIGLRMLAILASIVLLGAAFRNQADAVAIQKDQRYVRNLIEDGLLQNLYDDSLLARFEERPDIVHRLTPWMRAGHLSIFAGPDASLFGHPLAEAGAVAEAPCLGSFAAAEADPALGQDGVRVNGWALMRHAFEASNRVYIVDASETIVGFASTPFGSNAWTGYSTAAPGTAVTAFAFDKAKRLCWAGTRIVTEKPGSAQMP